MMESVDEILSVLRDAGQGHYGESAVTQLEHALQCATLAERDGAPPTLIAAALLHDIGHLVNPDDRRATARGEDGEHEQTGAEYLARWFGEEVTRPVYLHVAAKRYLTAADPIYAALLSPASALSLRLQGGAFPAEMAERFAAQPGAEGAIRLRRWDEAAKVPGATTPPLGHFRQYLALSLR